MKHTIASIIVGIILCVGLVYFATQEAEPVRPTVKTWDVSNSNYKNMTLEQRKKRQDFILGRKRTFHNDK